MTEYSGLMRPILERNEAGEMMSALRKPCGPSRGDTLTVEDSLGTSLSDYYTKFST